MHDEACRKCKTCPDDDKKHSGDPQHVSPSGGTLSDEDNRISHDGQARRWKASSDLNSRREPPSVNAKGRRTR
jgi:hypothetical protein